MSRFINSQTWTGGPGSGDEITWLGPSLGKCTTAKVERKADTNAPKPKLVGTIVHWEDARGFGFLREDIGGQKVFIHASDVRRSGLDGLFVDERVGFDTFEDAKGRKSAVNIRTLS